jgi:hypothetical protein
MFPYRPLKITGNSVGLVQSREEFILPDDAYPTLQNAFVWRERIKRKQGYTLLGRLRRTFTTVSLGLSGTSPWTVSIFSSEGLGGIITNVTQANPGQVTSPNHNLTSGEIVLIDGVVGMTQLNGNQYTVTVVDANNFTIGVNTTGYSPYVSGGTWILANQPNATLQPGSVVIVIGTGGGAITFTDQGNGTLTSPTPGNSGTINYITGIAVLTTTATPGTATTVSFAYYPGLPVMGIRTRDLNTINSETTVFFDTTYAYNFSAGGFVEFIPGETWSGGLPNANSNFFWTTNYWVSAANIRLFWATNFSGPSGDPIRYTDGVGNGTGTWTDFGASSPTGTGQIDAAGNYLNQCLALLPFRGRLVAFNTYEGQNLATSVNYFNRIRWSAIGNPLTVDSTGPPVVVGAWRDDIRGKGGFLNIPTNEDIIAVGFVRDNLVVYCENSTWQLRYTGRAIAPFQIEKVNAELGTGSTFSAVQFDTSLVGVGDKGLVQCDSFKSERIDIKIPDLVMQGFNNNNNGQKRVHGIRDFLQRLAYWTYPATESNGIFPDRRLVYNYENDSWAIFTDSLTTLGTFQPISGRTWANPTGGTPSEKVSWEEANFPWVNQQASILAIVGGNQQGYIEYLDDQVSNDESLFISAITGNTTTPTQITSPNHNMQTGYVISISSIPTGTPFASTLNGNVFGIQVVDANNFLLLIYDPTTQEFSQPQLDPPGVYVGGGQILVRDNFSIVSKKFNFLDQGQNIQIGYIDILLDTPSANSANLAAITLNVFVDYDEETAINQQNDSFFNNTIPTFATAFQTQNSSKTMQRVYCPVRGNFLTLQYTLSNAQMAGTEQENDVQIDSQVIWLRPAGRLGSI